MKIKGQTTSVTLGDIYKILGISAVVGIIIRCIQMAKFIDSETGFATGGKLLSVILILLLVATVLCFLVKAYLTAESEKIQLQGVKSKPLGAATAFFAASFAEKSALSKPLPEYTWKASLSSQYVIDL